MLKLILDDYIRGFCTAWKKGISETAWFMYIYLSVLPMIKGVAVDRYFFGMFPMILGILLARMYPNQISKILFLCPLTEQDRKKYLQMAYWLRVSIPMILCLGLGAVSMAWGEISLFYYAAVSLLVFFYLMGVNIYCVPDKQSPNAMERIYPLPGIYEVWDVLIQIVGVIGVFVTITMEGEAQTDKIIMAVFVLLEMLLFIKMRITYYWPVMLRGMQYESSYAAKIKK